MTKAEKIFRKIESRRELLDTGKVDTVFDRNFKPSELLYRGRIALTKMMRVRLRPLDYATLRRCKRQTSLLPQTV